MTAVTAVVATALVWIPSSNESPLVNYAKACNGLLAHSADW